MNNAGTYSIEGPIGPETVINGRKYLYFAGTGYFQLQSHPEVIEAAVQAMHRYGMAGATSRTMAGTTPLLSELETELARFWGTEDAAYLPSGYLVSLAAISALEEMGLFDIIFLDEASHYSLVDAVKTSSKKVIGFRHQDTADLRKKLKLFAGDADRPLIASDGVFPVAGSLAPLPRYMELAEQYDGIVWIDDSHGAGILGNNGRGSAEHLGIRSERVFSGGTLSKAFGAYGGFIQGNSAFIARVREGSVMTGSNAPPGAAIAASIKGLELVRDHPGMRVRLWENARYLKEGLASLDIRDEASAGKTGPDCMDIPVAAFSLPGQDARGMKSVQKALMEEGIFIQYTGYRGAGPEGFLRIVVFSTHTTAQIDRLIDTLNRHLPGRIKSPAR